MTHVFISYVRDDQHEVDRMCADLRSAGVHVWLDREQIKPGQRWRRAIREAIRTGAYFVACFSSRSVARSRTYMNEELTLAIDELRQMPAQRTWFIPVLLSQCEVPDTPIGGGETLRDLQWISFELGWDRAMAGLLDAVGSAQPMHTEEVGALVPEQQHKVVLRDKVDVVHHIEFRRVDFNDALLLEFERDHEDQMDEIDVLVLDLRFYYSDGIIGHFPIPVLGAFEGNTFRQVIARAVKQYESHSEWVQCNGYKKNWDRQWLGFLRRRDDSIQLELADGRNVDLPWSEKIDAYVMEKCYSSDDWVYPGIKLHI